MTKFITRNHKGNWFEVAIKTDDEQHYLAAQNFARSLIGHEKPCEVSTVRHARWIRMDAHKGMAQFKCSICRSECYVPTCMDNPMYEYCPNCGSRMDGGADNITI